MLDLGGGAAMKLVLIYAGKFLMGEQDHTVHEVTLTKPFYMGVTEVTQAQYEALGGTNLSQFKGRDQPGGHGFVERCRGVLQETVGEDRPERCACPPRL